MVTVAVATKADLEKVQTVVVREEETEVNNHTSQD